MRDTSGAGAGAGAGFADLNLPLAPEVDAQAHRERLALALRLGARRGVHSQLRSVSIRTHVRACDAGGGATGYNHVATVHTADAATLADSDVRFARTHGVHLLHARLLTLRCCRCPPPRTQRCRVLPLDVAVLRAATSSGADVEHNAAFVQHSRLTVVLDEQAHCARLAAATDVTRSYDLLAVQPVSERAFLSACTTLDVDIISLDLARRLPFRRAVPLF
jgi:hypothetical protein